MILSQGGYEASDEDIENAGASISYAMPNGMTVGAYTFKSEDDLDAGEEYTRSGVELQYTIATGLQTGITYQSMDVTVADTPNADNDGTYTTFFLKHHSNLILLL